MVIRSPGAALGRIGVELGGPLRYYKTLVLSYEIPGVVLGDPSVVL